MRFRKNSIWFFELLISMILMDAVSVVIIIFEQQSLILTILMSVLIKVGLLPLIIIEGTSYILMDETGIKCIKRNQINWSYEWDEIKELRKHSVMRNPGIHIFLKVEQKVDLQVTQNRKSLDFQLTPTAKKALQIFSPFHN